MYIPEHFNISNDEEVDRFIKANAFGQLIATLDGKLVATHMPFLFQSREQGLLAHMAKANPQWRQLDGQEVLIILPGPHAYISPSWYHKPGVPTWNYQAVHIVGTASCFSDPESLQQVIDNLTDINEMNFESPWQPEYEAAMLGGIMGIEITIREIQCQFKLSQNRDRVERKNVSARLRAEGEVKLAAAMENVPDIN